MLTGALSIPTYQLSKYFAIPMFYNICLFFVCRRYNDKTSTNMDLQNFLIDAYSKQIKELNSSTGKTINFHINWCHFLCLPKANNFVVVLYKAMLQYCTKEPTVPCCWIPVLTHLTVNVVVSEHCVYDLRDIIPLKWHFIWSRFKIVAYIIVVM